MRSCRAACACRHYFFGQRRPDGLGLLSACALNISFCMCTMCRLLVRRHIRQHCRPERLLGCCCCFWFPLCLLFVRIYVIMILLCIFFCVCSMCRHIWQHCRPDGLLGSRSVPDSWSPVPQPRALMYPPGSYQFPQLTFLCSIFKFFDAQFCPQHSSHGYIVPLNVYLIPSATWMPIQYSMREKPRY